MSNPENYFAGQPFEAIAKEGVFGQPLRVPRAPIVLRREEIPYGYTNYENEDVNSDSGSNAFKALAGRLFPSLTSVQSQLIDYVIEGLAQREIATRLGVSEVTIKKRIGRIYDQMGEFRGKHHLARVKHEWDLLSLDEQKKYRKTHEVNQERKAQTENKFTNSELGILRLLAAGKRNKEIAADLGLNPQTTKNTISRIKDKLGAGNRADIIKQALEMNLA